MADLHHTRLWRLRAPGLRLSMAQKRAILLGSGLHYAGCREVGVSGATMIALRERGLAVIRTEHRPYRRMTYRLTEAGEGLRVAWEDVERERQVATGFTGEPLHASAVELMLREHPPIEHERIAVHCDHCGWDFDDGTGGGSCGRCGQVVRAVVPVG